MNLLTELKDLIASQCDDDSRTNLLLVSKNWNQLVGHNKQFRQYCRKRYFKINRTYSGLGFRVHLRNYTRPLFSLKNNKIYSIYIEVGDKFKKIGKSNKFDDISESWFKNFEMAMGRKECLELKAHIKFYKKFETSDEYNG